MKKNTVLILSMVGNITVALVGGIALANGISRVKTNQPVATNQIENRMQTSDKKEENKVIVKAKNPTQTKKDIVTTTTNNVTDTHTTEATTYDQSKAKNANFDAKDTATYIAEPRVDVHLVSVDGAVDTWATLNTNGYYFNNKGVAFVNNGSGVFTDENGLIYTKK